MGWADNLRLQSILPVALSMMSGQDDDTLGVATKIAGTLGRNRARYNEMGIPGGRPIYEDSPESGGYGGNLPPIPLGGNRVNWPDFGGGIVSDEDGRRIGDAIQIEKVVNNPNYNPYGPEENNLPSRVSPQLEMSIPGGNPTSSNPRAIGDSSPDNDTAFELFKRSILGMPERKRPGIWRALGTGALSAAYGLSGERGDKPLGYDEAEHILYGPYNKAIERWGQQTGALKDLANIEMQTERSAGLPEQRRAAAEGTLRRAGVAETAEARKQREGEANIELRQRKLDIDEWKARNPTGKVVMQKGGNVILVNPQTGETIDTGIPTGSLSDTDKIDYQHKNTVSDINLRHQNELKELEQRHKERLGEISATGEIQKEVAGVKGEESRKTKGTPSVSTVEYKSDKGTTTTQGTPGGAVVAKTEIPKTGERIFTTPPPITERKIGDILTYPNGRKGIWDGKGWVAQ